MMERARGKLKGVESDEKRNLFTKMMPTADRKLNVRYAMVMVVVVDEEEEEAGKPPRFTAASAGAGISSHSSDEEDMGRASC